MARVRIGLFLVVFVALLSVGVFSSWGPEIVYPCGPFRGLGGPVTSEGRYQGWPFVWSEIVACEGFPRWDGTALAMDVALVAAVAVIVVFVGDRLALARRRPRGGAG